MHPVEEGHYVLPTNPLEEFVNVVVSWIRSGLVGALVPGLQRVGKSFAIDYFKDNYRTWVGDDISVISAEVMHHKQYGEGVFFGDLLRSMGFPPDRKRPEDRRTLLIGRMVAAGANSRLKKVVIFIDEAQKLDDFLFNLLISVHNEVFRLYRIKIFWVFVGQPELATFAATYAYEGKRQIVGRFMTDTFVFRPLAWREDFDEALSLYDDKMRYPENGPTFTEYYAPSLVASGWSLASEADLLATRIESARAERGLPVGGAMTMQGFTTLMNYLFAKVLPSLKVGRALSEAVVDEAIISSNCLIFEEQEALLPPL